MTLRHDVPVRGPTSLDQSASSPSMNLCPHFSSHLEDQRIHLVRALQALSCSLPAASTRGIADFGAPVRTITHPPLPSLPPSPDADSRRSDDVRIRSDTLNQRDTVEWMRVLVMVRRTGLSAAVRGVALVGFSCLTRRSGSIVSTSLPGGTRTRRSNWTSSPRCSSSAACASAGAHYCRTVSLYGSNTLSAPTAMKYRR
jgi:hypothetical protein